MKAGGGGAGAVMGGGLGRPQDPRELDRAGADRDQFRGRNAAQRRGNAAFADAILQNLALKRFVTAEEVAAVACFLLSDDASYVTGSQYFVDGGMTFR